MTKLTGKRSLTLEELPEGIDNWCGDIECFCFGVYCVNMGLQVT
jgi:hypothetical protein